MPGKILIIEDEERIARFIELELIHEGYEVTKCTDGREGLTEAESGKYHVVLLDIMLPGLNGLEVLRRLRRTSSVPMIMLTARDAVMDKVNFDLEKLGRTEDDLEEIRERLNVKQEELLSAAGFRTVRFPGPADIFLLNTCTVTGTGDKKSLQLIRKIFQRELAGHHAFCLFFRAFSVKRSFRPFDQPNHITHSQNSGG